MNIDRKEDQGGLDEAIKRIKFVLDEIEKLPFNGNEFFSKTWGNRLTYEEIIGALVSAEQEIVIR